MYLLLGKIVAVKKTFPIKEQNLGFFKKITNIYSNHPQTIYISVRLFTPFEKFEKSSSAGLIYQRIIRLKIAFYYKLRVTVWLLQSADCDDRAPMINFIT